jgi:hypothetical protein
MPYIKQYERKKYEHVLKSLQTSLILLSNEQLADELNYLITSILKLALGSSPRYSEYNLVIGVLESVQLELYRRMVAPYEDWKIAENDDVT